VDADPTPPIEVVTSVREPLIALEDVRARRARGSTAFLLAAGLLEGVGGLTVVLAADDPALRGGAGSVLFVGGTIHAVQAYYQSDLSRRRHIAFVEHLAAVDDQPAAWPGLADAERLQLERESRSHAYATGLYSGVLGMGALTLLTSLDTQDRAAEAGAIALTAFGGIGLVHHAARWRACVRIAGDLGTVSEGIPTVVP
jgi:hypothetical protein